jgi:hypothetical protein
MFQNKGWNKLCHDLSRTRTSWGKPPKRHGRLKYIRVLSKAHSVPEFRRNSGTER